MQWFEHTFFSRKSGVLMIKHSVKFCYFNANFITLNLFLDSFKPSESNYIRPLAFTTMET